MNYLRLNTIWFYISSWHVLKHVCLSAFVIYSLNIQIQNFSETCYVLLRHDSVTSFADHCTCTFPKGGVSKKRNLLEVRSLQWPWWEGMSLLYIHCMELYYRFMKLISRSEGSGVSAPHWFLLSNRMLPSHTCHRQIMVYIQKSSEQPNFC